MPLPTMVDLPDATASAPRLRLIDPQHPDRAEVEDFIGRVFAQRFQARLTGFAPALVALHDAQGRITAAAGYRPADAGPLFLERYLAAPVEALLAPHAGGRPPRAGIVEVGHLAASQAGAGRRLIGLMGPHLAAQGFQWVVSTLTEELRQLFLRIGVAPLALGCADPEALGSEAASWGCYYEHRPVVLAGHLPQALKRLQQRGLLAPEACQ